MKTIMFMSANEGDESEIKGFEMGATDYIHKPLKPDVLLRRVGNIIENLEKIRKLEVTSSTDSLTKLLNKSAAQRKIGEMVNRENDLAGRMGGDEFVAEK